MDRIEFDANELDAATNYHGGQSSMLYAIASTGSLSRGTNRPHVECGCNHGWETPSEPCRKCRGAKMTDAQWLAHLAEKLEGEASTAAEHALEGDSPEDAEPLNAIAAKCRAAIAQLTGKFSTWTDVIAAALRGEQLLYGSPMDAASAHAFRHVRVVKVFKNGKLRIDPMSNLCDPFTADSSHLDRFRCKPIA